MITSSEQKLQDADEACQHEIEGYKSQCSKLNAELSELTQFIAQKVSI